MLGPIRNFTAAKLASIEKPRYAWVRLAQQQRTQILSDPFSKRYVHWCCDSFSPYIHNKTLRLEQVKVDQQSLIAAEKEVGYNVHCTCYLIEKASVLGSNMPASTRLEIVGTGKGGQEL